jgi:hypothetical protein
MFLPALSHGYKRLVALLRQSRLMLKENTPPPVEVVTLRDYQSTSSSYQQSYYPQYQLQLQSDPTQSAPVEHTLMDTGITRSS